MIWLFTLVVITVGVVGWALLRASKAADEQAYVEDDCCRSDCPECARIANECFVDELPTGTVREYENHGSE